MATELEKLAGKFIDKGNRDHVADDGNDKSKWFRDAKADADRDSSPEFNHGEHGNEENDKAVQNNHGWLDLLVRLVCGWSGVF